MASVIVGEKETLEKALKRYKKLVDRENIIQEWKNRSFYEKPSVERNRKNNEIKRKLRNRRKKMSGKKFLDRDKERFNQNHGKPYHN